MKKILITGASGFVGSHLIEYVKSLNTYDMYGTVYGQGNTIAQELLDNQHIFSLNLLDEQNTLEVVTKIQPEYVVHLAALSSPQLSKVNPAKTITNNIAAQVNLLEALKNLEQKPTTLIIGSAEEYGLVDPKDLPIDEETSLNPTNPYAVSKVAQDYMGLQYHLSEDIPIIRIRAFNHTGERRPPTFVIPAFVKQVVEIEAGQKSSLQVLGDLEVTRDFTDVKDMVRAYELALHKCQPGDVYNIGSGKGVVISDLLNLILSKSDQAITVEKDDSKQGKSGVKSLICDYSKFHQATGWQPEIPLSDTVDRVMHYWRHNLKENHHE